MSKVSITRSLLDTLANSISTKSGVAVPMTLAEMNTAVNSITPGGGGTMQTKSVSYTPSETAVSDTVTPDSGYDGISSLSVSVGAVDSSYVGTGITRRSSSDLSASGATVTAPAGYYAEAASKTVTGASSWTLVATKTYTVNTTSTTAATTETWSTGDSSIWTSSKYVLVRIRDNAGARSGYFYGSDTFFANYLPANSSSTTSTTSATFGMLYRYSNGAFATRYSYGTTGYGVYADTIYSDGRVRIRQRYNSTYSLTINGTYTAQVYLLDTPDGGAIMG